MKYLIMMASLVTLISVNCVCADETSSPKRNFTEDIDQNKKKPMCPKAHTDSIVPILYGFPTEEMFAKSDSGLIVLGGCELDEFRYFCKIHSISF